MIDAAQLAALTPAQRARVIYSAAQSELASRLWHAAIGDPEQADADRPSKLRLSSDSMASLLALLEEQAGPSAPCACQPAPPPVPPGRPEPVLDDAPTAVPLPVPARIAEPVAAPGLGPNAQYRAAIDAAARASGVPASALAAVIDAEAARNADGSWNPWSRNPRSSAAGLGQFLSGTWQSLAESPGSALNAEAAARGWLDSEGRVRGTARGALLAMRYDADASIRGVADYARRNLDRLQARGVDLGSSSESTARAAYLGHHLGADDALKFLTSRIPADRARHLLQAQVGEADARRRITTTGDATRAHQEWLLGYLDRRIRPSRFGAGSS